MWHCASLVCVLRRGLEVLPVASASLLSSVGRDSADIDGKRVPLKSSVRNLGVHLDQTLCNNTSTVYAVQLRRIASIRPYLTRTAITQLVKSAVTSRLGYYNSILAGLPLKKISRVQRFQNNAAKLFFGKSKYEHVTPLLQELHWLPIKFRSQCRIATFVYRFFHSCLRGYLSQTHHLLKIPKRNIETYGEPSFSFLAPSVGNSLPSDLGNSSTLPLF